jgi:hypothetical protein
MQLRLSNGYCLAGLFLLITILPICAESLKPAAGAQATAMLVQKLLKSTIEFTKSAFAIVKFSFGNSLFITWCNPYANPYESF